MSLRPYQIEAVTEARKAAARGENPVVVIPTGGGKTHVGVSIVKSAVEKGNPVVWVAHRMELIDQASERLSLFGVEHGVIMAGRKEERSPLVQVASVQTLVRREMPPARVVVLDEAHHVRAATYARVLSTYPNAAIVGLTATPVRLDGRGLGEVFDTIVSPITCAELVEQGMLVAPRYYAPAQPDFTGVRKVGGDFDTSAAGKVMMRPALVGGVVEHYERLGMGGKCAVFACSIEHSEALVAAFKARGHKAAHLDGTTPTAERNAILADLRSGVLNIVSNVGVLTEGWDLPALSVCVLARPTDSWSLHLQMIGRVMRPHGDGKVAVVLDHAGNLVRHGFPTDPVEFDLGDASRKKSEAPKAKVCRACLATVPVGVSVCPACGTPFPVAPRTGPVLVDGDLKEVKPAAPTAADKEKELDRLLGIARSLGYARGWASRQYRARFGVWPRGPWFRPLVERHFKACGHVKREAGVCRFCRDGAADAGTFTEGAESVYTPAP